MFIFQAFAILHAIQFNVKQLESIMPTALEDNVYFLRLALSRGLRV